jgi:hypothetical protein
LARVSPCLITCPIYGVQTTAEYRELFTLGAALPRDLREGAVYLDVSREDIVIRRGQEALSAVRRPGQRVLVWVDLAAVRRELVAKVGVGMQ